MHPAAPVPAQRHRVRFRGHLPQALLTIITGLLIAFPLWVVCGFVISLFVGEGSVIQNLHLEPKTKLIRDFVDGYRQSLPIALLISLTSLLDLRLRESKALPLPYGAVTLLVAWAISRYVFGTAWLPMLLAMITATLVIALQWLLTRVIFRKAHVH